MILILCNKCFNKGIEKGYLKHRRGIAHFIVGRKGVGEEISIGEDARGRSQKMGTFNNDYDSDNGDVIRRIPSSLWLNLHMVIMGSNSIKLGKEPLWAEI